MFERGEVDALQDGCWLTPPTLKIESDKSEISEKFIIDFFEHLICMHMHAQLCMLSWFLAFLPPTKNIDIKSTSVSQLENVKIKIIMCQ